MSGPTADKATDKRKIKTLKPMEAVKRLRKLFDGIEKDAREEIADQMREGGIRAYAASWELSSPPSQKIWNAGPPEGFKKRKKISRKAFIGNKQWSSDAKNWKWRSGNFHLTKNSGKGWIYYFHVRFAEEDIDALIDRIVADRKKAPGGRPLEIDQWHDFWLRVVEMALNKELTAKTLSSPQEFQTAFLRVYKTEKDSPRAMPTVKDAISKILERFKDLHSDSHSDEPNSKT